ncbi:dihydrofolate reductase [Nakamurella antarctica]|uniref:Dihydrofolate reductase n=1 Tax=Nakamurella antarctica TaxID=1902245 RepID=A0A3G8ZKK3_9ACTN|nr:dihydrofolate reductase family protein [Nakamurella antarctica]AZI57375.1 dihydrofolate reductase [Nakamurella antarctica]
MRKVVAGLFYSLDGVVEAPHLWQFDSFDDQVGEAMTGMITETDTVLIGRLGYEQWSEYWPTADDEFGDFINPVQKFVASTTLSPELSWENSTLIEGDFVEFVTALKQSEGRDIAVCGSISLARQLIFAGLLDSLTLTMHPVIAGAGKRLFEPTDPTTRLTLAGSTISSKGNAILTYSLLADEQRLESAVRYTHSEPHSLKCGCPDRPLR